MKKWNWDINHFYFNCLPGFAIIFVLLKPAITNLLCWAKRRHQIAPRECDEDAPCIVLRFKFFDIIFLFYLFSFLSLFTTITVFMQQEKEKQNSNKKWPLKYDWVMFIHIAATFTEYLLNTKRTNNFPVRFLDEPDLFCWYLLKVLVITRSMWLRMNQ